jgi:hypothetical protein
VLKIKMKILKDSQTIFDLRLELKEIDCEKYYELINLVGYADEVRVRVWVRVRVRV